MLSDVLPVLIMDFLPSNQDNRSFLIIKRISRTCEDVFGEGGLDGWMDVMNGCVKIKSDV